MAAFQIAPPEPFDFTVPENWLSWSRRFDRFREVSGLEMKDDGIQISTLVYAMGSKAEEILAAFTLTKTQREDYSQVKAAFDGHFLKKKNTIFERAKFNQRRQRKEETADSFITDLYTLAEHCEFGDLHDQLIRDRLVVGICDAKLSESLQMDPELTLTQGIQKVRQSETVKQQQSVVRRELPLAPLAEGGAADAVRERRPPVKSKRGKNNIPK